VLVRAVANRVVAKSDRHPTADNGSLIFDERLDISIATSFHRIFLLLHPTFNYQFACMHVTFGLLGCIAIYLQYVFRHPVDFIDDAFFIWLQPLTVVKKMIIDNSTLLLLRVGRNVWGNPFRQRPHDRPPSEGYSY